MKHGQVSLYINISIIVTLTIFTGLFVSSLKIVLHNYYATGENKSIDYIPNHTIEFEYERSKLCPSHYKHWMLTIFSSYHDGNCSFSSMKPTNINNDTCKNDVISVKNDKKVDKINHFVTNGIRIIKPNSVQVTDCILALMLIVSVISAFVEMLRNRFMNNQDTSMRIGIFASRRPSIVDLVLPGQCGSQVFIKAQMAVDVRGLRCTPLRTRRACTSTCVRRSSFSIYSNFDGSINGSSSPPTSPCRTSVNVDSEAGIDTSLGLTRHSHLIRRH